MASYKPQLLTRKEASRYLNVSESTLDRITARKRLRTIRIGSLVRFRKEDLDDFINESY